MAKLSMDCANGEDMAEARARSMDPASCMIAVCESQKLTLEPAPDGVSCGPQKVCQAGACADACTRGAAYTPSSVDLLGAETYFADGAPLPAGRYYVRYLDGCMKYSSWQWWSLQASLDGTATWWLIGTDKRDRKAVMPGTEGFYPNANGNGSNKPGFEKFEQCVKANKGVPPLLFEHLGGRLGVWLNDQPYTDNVTGENGRSPSWELVQATKCDSPE